MKSLTMILAVAGLAVSGSVFAQTTIQAPSANNAATYQVAQTGSSGYDGQWVAPYGQPVHQKTRAEVYQELVHAEQDGQLQYLNSTLYAH